MYTDQSVLDGVCGQYEAERFNISMIIFLVPYLDWVNESPGQLNFKKKKEFILKSSRTRELILLTHTAVERASRCADMIHRLTVRQ